MFEPVPCWTAVHRRCGLLGDCALAENDVESCDKIEGAVQRDIEQKTLAIRFLKSFKSLHPRENWVILYPKFNECECEGTWQRAFVKNDQR